MNNSATLSQDSPTFQGSIGGQYGRSRSRDPRATRQRYTVGPDVRANVLKEFGRPWSGTSNDNRRDSTRNTRITEQLSDQPPRYLTFPAGNRPDLSPGPGDRSGRLPAGKVR